MKHNHRYNCTVLYKRERMSGVVATSPLASREITRQRLLSPLPLYIFLVAASSPSLHPIIIYIFRVQTLETTAREELPASSCRQSKGS